MTTRDARLLILSVFCAALLVACGACGSGTTTLTPLTPSGVRCGVTLVPTISTIDSSGGTGILKVDTARECQWAVTGTPRWMTFKSATEGQGPAEVAFVVEPNRSTAERRVELVVAEQRVVISQKAATCAFKMTPDAVSVGGEGGEIKTVLATDDFCSWTISSREPWIEVKSDTSGQGTADIKLRVDNNNGAERTGTVEFPSGTLRITQTSPSCNFEVTPGDFDNVGSGASERSVDVKTGATCGWTANTSASWITVSPTSGNGSGKVRFTLLANSGAKRTGVVVVAGKTITVTQNTGIVPCTYTVTPSSLSFSSSAQTKNITVTTNKPTCAVNAVSSAPSWLHVGSYAATGSGKIPIMVDANPSSTTKRNAAITVTGESFSQVVKVEQDKR